MLPHLPYLILPTIYICPVVPGTPEAPDGLDGLDVLDDLDDLDDFDVLDDFEGIDLDGLDGSDGPQGPLSPQGPEAPVPEADPDGPAPDGPTAPNDFNDANVPDNRQPPNAVDHGAIHALPPPSLGPIPHVAPPPQQQAPDQQETEANPNYDSPDQDRARSRHKGAQEAYRALTAQRIEAVIQLLRHYDLDCAQGLHALYFQVVTRPTMQPPLPTSWQRTMQKVLDGLCAYQRCHNSHEAELMILLLPKLGVLPGLWRSNASRPSHQDREKELARLEEYPLPQMRELIEKTAARGARVILTEMETPWRDLARTEEEPAQPETSQREAFQERAFRSESSQSESFQPESSQDESIQSWPREQDKNPHQTNHSDRDTQLELQQDPPYTDHGDEWRPEGVTDERLIPYNKTDRIERLCQEGRIREATRIRFKK
ncbi:hypothetical protein MNAN1_002198 [Malassezia nana]|uniref:Uncharacterized protein n=1 Tax=Malassezia nana TaxID=180528 RepID=A0AAF0J2N6_9BASI|nr:hypothetical protein MNAN1_002198 [Malassezia nana]